MIGGYQHGETWWVKLPGNLALASRTIDHIGDAIVTISHSRFNPPSGTVRVHETYKKSDLEFVEKISP